MDNNSKQDDEIGNLTDSLIMPLVQMIEGSKKNEVNNEI
jgi:hypothetical protein